MKNLKFLGTTVLQSAMFTSALVLAAPAMAQEPPAERDDPSTLQGEVEVESGENVAPAVDCAANPASPECQDIVVTGSRIRRPNLESAVPVTAIGGEEFFETGQVSVGDVLNELPALRSTFSQANSTRFLGTAGLNLLDLRGLGTVRTLVLQNGRRHVGGDVLSSGVTPDVNTIPTDLIERVEVVTGGNSAVYGSDAIAGVVNFILKDDYEGLQLRGQGGVSKYGDAGSYFISGLWGTNFADGRGNVAVNAEYARQQQYFGAGRPYIAENDIFLVTDTDPAGSPNGSDGVPDRLFFRDVRSASLTNTGAVRIGGGTSPLNCGSDPTGLPANRYACFYIFQPDGTLVPATGTRVGIGPFGSYVGGNSESFRGGKQFQMSPQLDRYNINLLAHFDVSEAFTPFVEAKYSRTDSSGTGSSGPAFIQGATLVDPLQFFTGRNRELFRLDNPFLSGQARGVIEAARLANGQASSDATQVAIRQNLLGLGARTEEAKRETYRIVGGFRGNFWDDWNYELAFNYGKLKEKTKILGNLDIQRFLLGMDAVDEGDYLTGTANGNIVCRSQIDPDAAVGYWPWVYGTDPNAQARLDADVAACVPINPFGGNFDQQVRNYTLRNTVATGETSQFNVVGFIGGDTSSFLNLPGGPISFVLGGEYRADDVYYDQDDDITLGYTFYNAINTFEAPKSKVKEAFGEIRIPILKDTRFFEELEVSAAARISDYSIGNTGSVWAYNASAIWSPVEGLRLRGNYGRSVRAPNQVELFSPFSQNFAPGFQDPCSERNITTTTRLQNCTAAGRPAGYDFVYSSSLEIQSGGNPTLEAETADSYTVGAVVTPKFMPGFSFSADYYNIKVKDVITGVAAQTIANQCYDLPAGNPFCALFERNSPTATTDPFRIVEGSLIQGPVNFAKLTAKGIDVEAAYRGQLFDIGRLDTRFTWTHVLDRSNYLDPTNPDVRNVIVGKNGGELGDPKDAFNWNVSLQRGIATFGYQMRYLSAMYLNTYEDFNTVQDRPPENADYADRKKYPAVFYHDVRLGLDATKDFNFYLGVDNLTNKEPPLGLTGIGAGSAIYDARGRFFYAGAIAKF